jgi:hypothetical protein
MKNYKIKKKKIVETLDLIGLISILIASILSIVFFVMSLFLDISYDNLMFFILFSIIFVSLIFSISSYICDMKSETKKYLREISLRVKESFDIEDLNDIRNEFCNEAIDEYGIIRLEFPIEIKKMIKEIDGKIEIIEKFKMNSYEKQQNTYK